MSNGPYGVDYRKLLKKYMKYVEDCDGSFFLPYEDDDTFSRGEYYVLDEIADDILAEKAKLNTAKSHLTYKSPEHGGLYLRKVGEWFRFDLHLGNSIPYSVTPAVIPALGCNRSNMPDMTRPPSPWLWGVCR